MCGLSSFPGCWHCSVYYNYAVLDMLGPTRQHPNFSSHGQATHIPLLMSAPQFRGNVQHAKGLIRQVVMEKTVNNKARVRNGQREAASLQLANLNYLGTLFRCGFAGPTGGW